MDKLLTVTKCRTFLPGYSPNEHITPRTNPPGHLRFSKAECGYYLISNLDKGEYHTPSKIGWGNVWDEVQGEMSVSPLTSHLTDRI